MDERVAVLCPRCGRRFDVAASLGGKRGRCSACGATFDLPPAPQRGPEPEPADEWADRSAEAWESAADAPATPAPPPPPRANGAKVGTLFARFEQTLLYKAGLVAFIVLCAGVIGYFKFQKSQRANRAATAIGEQIAGPAVSDRSDPPPLSPFSDKPAPAKAPAELPPPPALQFVQEGGHSVGKATVTDRRARGTRVRLFLPPGEHAEASLPCVFVCPAGSNLLVGVPFGDDEHADFLPLLDRGVAVCFYTLDGTVKDLSNVPEMVLAIAMRSYAASEGGLHNLADAIDTVLAGTRAVDPARLGVCGHSSAGTIAVMAVGREPRIAAGAAMAPALDLPKRLGQEVLDALPGESTRLAHSGSPSSIEHVERPLLIFQARDDTNTPVGEAESFAARHAANVSLKLIDAGGHGGAYVEGLAPCFDFLAKTLGANPARATEAIGQRAPAAPPSPVSPPAPTARSAAAPPEAVRVAPAPAPATRPAHAPAAARPAIRGLRPFTGVTHVLGKAQMKIDGKPWPGFTHAYREGRSEIFAGDPAADPDVASLRVYALRRPTARLTGSRQPRPDAHADGAIRVDADEQVAYLHSPAATKQVPFLTGAGTAQRTEAADRDGGRPTREVLYGATINGILVVMHIVADGDDAEGVRKLEEVIRAFELKG